MYLLHCLHSFVDGHLGRFHFLANVINHATSIDVQIFSVFFGIYPRVVFLAYMVILFFSYLGNLILLFFLVATPVYILANSVTRIPVSTHPHQHLLSFSRGHPNCELMIHFDLNFPDD